MLNSYLTTAWRIVFANVALQLQNPTRNGGVYAVNEIIKNWTANLGHAAFGRLRTWELGLRYPKNFIP